MGSGIRITQPTSSPSIQRLPVEGVVDEDGEKCPLVLVGSPYEAPQGQRAHPLRMSRLRQGRTDVQSLIHCSRFF